MRVVPFEAGHLECLKIQAAQADMKPYLTRDYGAILADAGPAFTGLAVDRVLGCAGVQQIWPGRGVAWSLLGDLKTGEFPAIHRAILRFLDEQPLRRLEITVDGDHHAGHRWARLLGFHKEGRLRAYTPNGRDCDLYARIK